MTLKIFWSSVHTQMFKSKQGKPKQPSFQTSAVTNRGVMFQKLSRALAARLKISYPRCCGLQLTEELFWVGFQLPVVLDEPSFRLPRCKTEGKLGIRYNGIC